MKRTWYSFHYNKKGNRRRFYKFRQFLWMVYLRRKYGKNPITVDIGDHYYSTIHRKFWRKVHKKEKLRGKRIE